MFKYYILHQSFALVDIKSGLEFDKFYMDTDFILFGLFKTPRNEVAFTVHLVYTQFEIVGSHSQFAGGFFGGKGVWFYRISCKAIKQWIFIVGMKTSIEQKYYCKTRRYNN